MSGERIGTVTGRLRPHHGRQERAGLLARGSGGDWLMRGAALKPR
jgi:hypothetical protein